MVALPGAAVASVVAPEPARAAAGPLERPDDSSAFELARQRGQRVEVTSARTETETVFVNPSGSYTLEQTARPVRVRRSNGWVPVDTTLVKQADGTVTAKATAATLSFSGGGAEAPMAEIQLGRSRLSLDWPEPLPTPALSGDTATYAEVLPGVDLKIRADVDGFSQVLMVKSAEAGANPKLAELRLALAARGVDPQVDSAGNLRAVGSDGETAVFHAAAPTMWDSSGSGSTAQALLERPATGARIAAMDTVLENETLVVVPDQEMLKDPETEYPVYIDPSVSVGRPAWAYVNKEFPNQAYYNRGDDDTGIGYEPQQNSTKRAFWRFQVAGRTVGAEIMRATFRARVTHAFGCGDAQVHLWLTSMISSATTWNNQPTKARWLDTQTVNTGRSGCDNGSGVEWNATSAYRSGASEGWNSVVLGLYGNETVSASNFDWRRFASNPTLQVDYNHPPNKPTDLQDSHRGDCVTDVAAAPSVNTKTPYLYAKIYDKDRAFVSGTQVKAQFEWAVGGTRIGGAETPYLTIGATGSQFKVLASFNTDEGRVVGWRVRGIDREGANNATPGPISPWCFLRIDTTAPKAPAVSSAQYPDDEANYGSIGLPGTFTFSPGSSDTARYEYSFNMPTCTKSVSAGTDGKASIQFVPTEWGTNQLYARAVDDAGNRSGPCQVALNFGVADPSNPVAHFRFNEGTGTTAADTAEGAARSATFTGGMSWTRGRVGESPADPAAPPRFTGTAVHSTGSSDSGAHTPDAVVDNRKAFSVAAWVRLDRTGRNYTAVGQDGTQHSGFYLGYEESAQRWMFKMPNSDADATTWVQVDSLAAPQLGAWTHLLAAYDPVAKTATLYVNGVKQGTATDVPPRTWQATGGLQVARAKYNSSYADEWVGDIDDVRVYNRVITDKPTVAGNPESRELWQMVNAPFQLQGHYPMHTVVDDLPTPLTGTEVPDASDNSQPGTLHGDPAQVWTGLNDGNRTPGGHFNGTSDYIDTTGPALRTDAPFTVAAWVRLGDKISDPNPDLWTTAVSQAGVRNSGFYLQYAKKSSDGLTYWALALRVTDTDHAVTPRVFSRETAEIGDWTHLAATYDPIDKKITLWVDGAEQGSTTLSQPQSWNAAGPVQIGRAKINGIQGMHWGGDIDDVHLYQGLVSSPGITRITSGFYPILTS